MMYLKSYVWLKLPRKAWLIQGHIVQGTNLTKIPVTSFADTLTLVGYNRGIVNENGQQNITSLHLLDWPHTEYIMLTMSTNWRRGGGGGSLKSKQHVKGVY
jgi:hypothetical protein